jgi:hypothetical protein
VYSANEQKTEFKVEDEIRIIPGSTYTSGAKMPTQMF